MIFRPITNKVDLLAYIKRRLGAPAHGVQITDDQYEDCINDALELFLKTAYSGTDRSYILFDVIKDQSMYELPDDVLAVTQILDGDRAYPKISMLPPQYASPYNMQLSNGSFVNYVIINSYLDSMGEFLNADILYNFNEDTKELNIYSTPKSEKVLLEVEKYTGITESAFNKLYNNTWIKERSFANSMMMWAMNLIKYRGSLFDGGVELDKDAIMSEAKELVEKSNEDLIETYTDNICLIYK